MTIIFSKREIKKDKEKSSKKSYKDLAMYMYRKTFMPEIKPELLPFEEKYWNKVFPKEGPKGKISENDFKKLMISNIGGYSIFLPKYANSMAKVLRSYFPDNEKVTITDATSNMGGAVLGFCRYFDKVNAVEIVDLHCDILKNNMKLYKVDDQVNIICDDYIDVYKNTKQDIIFFDPPWGGVDYKSKVIFNLDLDAIPIDKIFKELLQIKNAKYLAMRLPFNYDFKKLFSITDKIVIHSFYREDGKLTFFLAIIQVN
tara:strand:+ start:2738 stop:3508 length:771 start_codon:yes stop_codon:yes gene_type:complete